MSPYKMKRTDEMFRIMLITLPAAIQNKTTTLKIFT